MPNHSGIGETRQHPDFYIPGGDLYLLVENVHFCVPSYFFTREPRSEFRKKLLNPSASPGVTISGRNHANALLLKGEKSEDVETFLRVVLNPKYTDFSFMTVQKWITVLNLAHKWKFDSLKEASIRELQKADIDIVSRVELYTNNGVDVRYILPLYADLCQRDGTALSWQESRRVGSDATFAVMQTRETMLRSSPPVVLSRNKPPRSPVPSEIPRASIFGILKEVLGIGDIDIEDHPSLQGNPADANTQTVLVDLDAESSTTPKLDHPQTKKDPQNPK